MEIMTDNTNCGSEMSLSPLVKLFTERAPCGAQMRPELVLSALIDDVRRSRARRHKFQDPLHLFFEQRRIHRVEVVPELPADGFIEPLGQCFNDGFRMVLKKSASAQRVRFTMAHEICHTFFYELVPELKFSVRSPDDQEERLCNLGAATLLVPNALLKGRASTMPVCLESLCYLADCFSVSLSTMLLRLQSLGLWQCQLSLWHRKADGSFLLDRLYGGKRLAWEWEDESILRTAWVSRRSIFGHTFVSVQEREQPRRYRPVSYQLRRYASGIMALWGNGIRPGGQLAGAPLFEGSSPVWQGA